MDFLDRLRIVDDAVDEFLSESALLVIGEDSYDIKGPFDRNVFTDETSSARVTSLVSTFSVQSHTIPEDPRGAFLSLRREVFGVVDMDAPKDGRTVLMLKRVGDMTEEAASCGGLPYVLPFVLCGGGQEHFEGLAYTLPFTLGGE